MAETTGLHWNLLLYTAPKVRTIDAVARFAGGPFRTLEEAEGAIPADWTKIPYQPT
jgi:hypothetical protein